MTTPRPDRWRELGSFIREQRATSRLSLRRLSELAGISNPYLSQIERGLRRPSAEILQQIAKALRISAETLYVQAGILDDHHGDGDLTRHILADPLLREEQKQALLRVYRSFLLENGAGWDEPDPGGQRPERAGGHADQRAEEPAAEWAEGRVDEPAEGRVDEPAEGRADEPAEGRADEWAEGRVDEPAEGRADRAGGRRRDTDHRAARVATSARSRSSTSSGRPASSRSGPSRRSVASDASSAPGGGSSADPTPSR